jgi:hypothetical protein
MDSVDTREAVRRRYAEVALRVYRPEGGPSACCGGTSCQGGASDPITSNLYSPLELADLPADAAAA